MSSTLSTLVDFGIIAIFLAGVAFFRTVKLARWGNQLAALALGLAVVTILTRHSLNALPLVFAAGLVGSSLGWIVAVRVSMIQIPAMVAFQHGAGGVAAFLVSTVEIIRSAEVGWTVGRTFGIFGVAIGAATFSASLVAAGKLSGHLGQKPTVLPRHGLVLLTLLVLVLTIMGVVGSFGATAAAYGAVPIIVIATIVGILVAVRVGGADMPVLISFLNATAGLAAACCGVIIQNRLLVACGATVAASGTVLTIIMCRAMNRGLGSVFTGLKAAAHSRTPSLPAAPDAEDGATGALEGQGGSTVDPISAAADVLRQARSVVIAPGYGMALAQAQFEVVRLADLLRANGASVSFAIHPVAGRMPGHMNVLLAEAEASYEDLKEMDEVNPDLPKTDVTVVIGACDVVNPAAIEQENTSISGMPILMVHQSRDVIVCNLDEKPGYSGVENPLYQQEHVRMLLGDAKTTIEELTRRLDSEPAEQDTNEGAACRETMDPMPGTVDVLRRARSVVIAPGYGMALAQAQFSVVRLANILRENGASVSFAIHPVAGRMPGHMNVLLAEAEASYEDLKEMEEINPDLPETDVAMVIGACDVVNPAAIEQENTTISGMPILMVHQARDVIVCNLDENPGYSGVDNPLYRQAHVRMLLGDAKATVDELTRHLTSEGNGEHGEGEAA